MDDNIAKKCSKSLVIRTYRKTIDYMAFKFLNQACAGHRPVRAWFLKVDPVQIVCMCVSAPRLLITSGVMWRDIDLI